MKYKVESSKLEVQRRRETRSTSRCTFNFQLSTFNLRKGMTTLELLMAMLIFVAVLGAIVTSLRYAYFGSRYVFEQSDATRTARTGIERIIRELRETAYADNGAFPLASIGANSITFYSDTDHNSDIEKVRYTLEDETLVRGVVNPSGVPPVYTATETETNLMQFVRNEALNEPLFTYYDVNSVEITDYTNIGDVASVDVNVTINLFPTRAPEDYTLRSSATLRNIVAR